MKFHHIENFFKENKSGLFVVLIFAIFYVLLVAIIHDSKNNGYQYEPENNPYEQMNWSTGLYK